MKKEDTRQIIADAFLKLVEIRDLDKITVSDIVKACEASRQTFYNHFHDKEELISWIYINETNRILQQMNVGKSYSDCLRIILCETEKKRGFYIKAYRMKEQNSLIETAVQHAQEYYRHRIEQMKGSSITDEQAFSIAVSSYGAIYAVRDWILIGSKLSAQQTAECIIASIPPEIRQYIE